MGFLKDAGDSVMKIGAKLVNRTEDYTKIARLSLDLRRISGEIEKVKAQIGEHVLKSRDEGKTRVDLSSSFIKTSAEKIADLKARITEKRKEIESLKEKSGDRPQDKKQDAL